MLFFLKMMIHVTTTSSPMISSPPTSLNWSYHTLLTTLFPSPLLLFRSQNIVWPFWEWNIVIHNIKLSHGFIGNTLSPIKLKTKVDTINQYHQMMILINQCIKGKSQSNIQGCVELLKKGHNTQLTQQAGATVNLLYLAVNTGKTSK